MHRLVRPAAALMTVLALTWGCVLLVDALAIEHHTSSVTVDAGPALVLDASGDGTVRVVGDGEADDITVDFSWREGLRAATTEVTTGEDGRVLVHTACPRMVTSFCTVDATIRVPVGTAVEGHSTGTLGVVGLDGPVDVSSDNGAVRIEGGEGPVTARSDNDRVVVVGRVGPLALTSDNGSIRTEDVEASTVTATSDNGDIDLELRIAPERIVTRTDNGSTRVVLPADAPAFATDLTTRNGSVEELIRTDRRADRTLEASSRNGSITVRYHSG